MHLRTTILRTLTAFVLLAGAVIVVAQDSKPIERFKAFAANLERGKSGVVEIAITRWSTDEEREKLLTTLQEFGRDKLVDELQKMLPVGSIRTPTTLAYDLYYARNNVLPDGSRHIILATNRPVSFREVVGSARSKDYQFTLVELHVGKDGKGEGKIVPAARVTWDKQAKKIEIENYNALPVDLLQVNAQKP